MSDDKSKIDESQLEVLLESFYDDFTHLYGANTNALKKHPFYLVAREPHAEAAGLNYSCLAAASDGQLWRVDKTNYVDAVKTLEQRGFVEMVSNESLVFNLTLKGYEKIFNLRNRPKLSRFGNFVSRIDSHSGFVSYLALFVAIIGLFYVVWSFYRQYRSFI